MVPATFLPLLAIVAVGAGALRVAANDRPAPSAGSAEPTISPSTITTTVARIDQVTTGETTAIADELVGGETSDDALGADEPGGGTGVSSYDDSAGALEQCTAAMEELLWREAAGVFDESVDDDIEEFSDEDLENIEVPAREFDGSVADPDAVVIADAGFGDDVAINELSDGELVRGIEACVESGVLPEDEDDEEHSSDDDDDEGDGDPDDELDDDD